MSGSNGKGARGGPVGNKNALTHGIYSYKALLNGDYLDERTALFKALREHAQDYVEALGGKVSVQEQALISDTVKVQLYIGSLDNYLFGLKSLIRKGRPHPVLAVRTQLATHLRENLKTLGIKKVPPPPKTMQEIAAELKAKREREAGAKTALPAEQRGNGEEL